ncbi:hypothetical protein CKAN_01324200 [Cinnamomum micranthum f. kanehirae]|uniref:Uncharacterized protein n=1 Tax=Cinnamomum micranthum f. kanehirae TaxID=337451 RepID=A0A3S4P1E5_9MAGN|nr:hypothetical protein CKAN_01324200 [Cinnamomum micranthum f. kanehirae]
MVREFCPGNSDLQTAVASSPPLDLKFILNHLTGAIPHVLTSLDFLSYLNLSYNNSNGGAL